MIWLLTSSDALLTVGEDHLLGVRRPAVRFPTMQFTPPSTPVLA